ncbi:hypothetical protein [Parvularcula oceani]|uniref:hypothetical protein n=1 Tax=Parvularcula oceani TaxID=1247963 RepID=UPI0012DCCDF2|nr:hypothetical protein [Parvularcula oceani]
MSTQRRLLRRSLRWWRKGLAYGLPAPLAERVRPATPHVVIFGTALSAEEQQRPVEVRLEGCHAFWTGLSIPAAGARRAKEAVELRLDELSPVPRSHTRFGIGRIVKAEEGRLWVPVAIAKADTVESATRTLPLAGGTVVASQDGRHVVLARREKERHLGTRTFSSPAVLASLLFVSMFVGAVTYTDRWVDAAGQKQVRLLAQLSAVEAEGDRLNALAVERDHRTLRTLRDWLGASPLPPDAMLTEFIVEDGSISLRGHLPVGADTDSLRSAGSFEARDERRPGWEAFFYKGTSDGE